MKSNSQHILVPFHLFKSNVQKLQNKKTSKIKKKNQSKRKRQKFTKNKMIQIS